MFHISLRLIVYYLVIFSSVSFFNPLGVISPEMSKLLFYIFFIFLSFLAIKRRHVKTDYPKLEICMIFFGLFTSMFVALIFHGQSLKDSAIAMIPNFFAYAFFPVLMQLQIPVEKILQSAKVFVISGMIVYIAKYVTFPNMIFG